MYRAVRGGLQCWLSSEANLLIHSCMEPVIYLVHVAEVCADYEGWAVQ